MTIVSTVSTRAEVRVPRVSSQATARQIADQYRGPGDVLGNGRCQAEDAGAGDRTNADHRQLCQPEGAHHALADGLLGGECSRQLLGREQTELV
ncbi:hypothetical protein GCM10009548_85270 [Streptomyces malaysiensis subsp. malaysiensis]